jgi:pre-mRNA-splicing factor CWC26
MDRELKSYLERVYGIGSEEGKKKLKKKQKNVRSLGNFSLVDDDAPSAFAKGRKEKNKSSQGDTNERKLLALGGWTSESLGGRRASSSLYQKESATASGSRNEADSGLCIPEQGRSLNVDEDGDLDFSLPSREGTFVSSDNVNSVDSNPKENDSEINLKVGLQTAEEIKEQSRKRKEKEPVEHYPEQDLTNESSDTVFRDRRGKKLGSYEEYVESRKRKSHFRNEPEYTWGAGIVQKQKADEERKRLADEMSRDFAVYKTDEELNERQRQQLRWGDPLLSQGYQKKTNISQDSNNAFTSKDRGFKPNPNVVSNERYRGPPPPPNRFNIEPGPRWDGIDRSNGFEKKVFDRVAKKVAEEEYAYKLSVEDM